MIKILFSNRTEKRLPNHTKSIVSSACEQVLKSEGFEDNAEISVSFVTNSEIKQINSEFRNIDKATDVLSFPLGENGEFDINPKNNCLMLGDIVISLQKAKEQAKEYGHSLSREIGWLTVHSMLHLLGYDHVENEKEAKIMHCKEEENLSALGLYRNLEDVK